MTFNNLFLLLAASVIGFDKLSYIILETDGQQRVCAKVKSGNLRTSVSVKFSTADGDATGTFTLLCLSCFIADFLFFFDLQHHWTTLQLLQPLPSMLLSHKTVWMFLL